MKYINLTTTKNWTTIWRRCFFSGSPWEWRPEAPADEIANQVLFPQFLTISSQNLMYYGWAECTFFWFLEINQNLFMFRRSTDILIRNKQKFFTVYDGLSKHLLLLNNPFQFIWGIQTKYLKLPKSMYINIIKGLGGAFHDQIHTKWHRKWIFFVASKWKSCANWIQGGGVCVCDLDNAQKKEYFSWDVFPCSPPLLQDNHMCQVLTQLNNFHFPFILNLS